MMPMNDFPGCGWSGSEKNRNPFKTAQFVLLLYIYMHTHPCRLNRVVDAVQVLYKCSLDPRYQIPSASNVIPDTSTSTLLSKQLLTSTSTTTTATTTTSNTKLFDCKRIHSTIHRDQNQLNTYTYTYTYIHIHPHTYNDALLFLAHTATTSKWLYTASFGRVSTHQKMGQHAFTIMHFFLIQPQSSLQH